MTSILDPEPEPEIEQLLKLYKDFEAIQHENEILLEKWNHHIRNNDSILNDLKSVKKELRTTR